MKEERLFCLSFVIFAFKFGENMILHYVNRVLLLIRG